MKKTLDIEELAIVVAAKNHNPTILNPDFLKYNEIVPADWKLAEPPICTPPLAQVKYDNGISIMSQLDKVIFTDILVGKHPEEAQVPATAAKYVKTLPHVDYSAVGVNPKGHVVVDAEEIARSYVRDTLISEGPWKTFVGQTPTVSVRFIYLIENGSLNLTIEDSFYTPPKEERCSVMIFACNIHREIVGETSKEKVGYLRAVIDAWKDDLKMFRDLIETNFLSGKVQP